MNKQQIKNWESKLRLLEFEHIDAHTALLPARYFFTRFLRERHLFEVTFLSLFFVGSIQAATIPGGGATPPDVAIESSQMPKANSPSFPIWEFALSGNTLLNEHEIERTLYHYLGLNKTIGDVEAARDSLQSVYRQAGYPTVLVNIPEQEVKDGVIQLKVVEGSIDRLRISGTDYFEPSRIRAAVPALNVGVIPHLPTVQRQLAALGSQSGDRQLTPVLRPGRTPGHLEVELRVKDELPLHGSIELNGRNSTSTTRTRLTGAIRYDNLWQRSHSFGFQYQLTPESPGEVAVISMTYVLPFSMTESDRVGENHFVIYGIRSRSKSDIASAGDLSVIGDGDVLGARGIFPLWSGANEVVQRLSVGIDYKDFREDIVLTVADTLHTPITYMPFSLNYDRNWRKGDGLAHAGIGIKWTIRGLVGQQNEFDDKRFLARSDFMVLTGGYDETFSLGRGFSIAPRFDFQFAGAPLISNEQYSIGGMTSVRGYYESQALGDDGFTAGAELETPGLTTPSARIDDLHAVCFLEGGRTNIHSPLAGTKRHQEIMGAGLGMRWRGWKRYSVRTDVAYPLLNNGVVKQGDWRIDFSLRGEF